MSNPPKCTHEHQHEQPPQSHGPVDESDIELQVGAPPRPSAVKRYSLALLLGLVGIVLLNLCGRAVYSLRHNWREAHRFLSAPSYPNIEFASDYINVRGQDGPIVHTQTPTDAGWHTANTTFPIDLTKQIWLDFKSGQTTIIISQSQTKSSSSPGPTLPELLEGEDGRSWMKGSMTLESTWSERWDTTSLMQGLLSTRLEVEGHSDNRHTVYIELPPLIDHIPFISIKSPSVDLIIDPSAAHISFGTAYFSTPRISRLPAHLNAHDLSIIADLGDIEGSYNISGRLYLQTNEGDIDASINLLDPSSPQSRSPGIPRKAAKVYAKTDIGDIGLSILSVAEGLETDVKAIAGVGDVEVLHAPSFEGRVEERVSIGERKMDLREGKEVCCETQSDETMIAWVWIEEKLEAGDDTVRVLDAADDGVDSNLSGMDDEDEDTPPICVLPNCNPRPPTPCVPPQCYIPPLAAAATHTKETLVQVPTPTSPPICVPPHCFPHLQDKDGAHTTGEAPRITATSPPICVPPHCYPHPPPGRQIPAALDFQQIIELEQEEYDTSPPICVPPHCYPHPPPGNEPLRVTATSPPICIPPHCYPHPPPGHHHHHHSSDQDAVAGDRISQDPVGSTPDEPPIPVPTTDVSPPICIPPHCWPAPAPGYRYTPTVTLVSEQPSSSIAPSPSKSKSAANSPSDLCLPPWCHPKPIVIAEHDAEASTPSSTTTAALAVDAADKSGISLPIPRGCLPPYCHPAPMEGEQKDQSDQKVKDPEPICMPPYCVPFAPLRPAVPTRVPVVTTNLEGSEGEVSGEVKGCRRCKGDGGRSGRGSLEARTQVGTVYLLV